MPGFQRPINATVVNISLGGAFLWCERPLNEGSETAFIAVFPPGTLADRWATAACRAKVMRADQKVVHGRFGTALHFVEVGLAH